jgi:superfamily II RNA helicase
MIHAEPGRLAELRYVVLDEVHYLQDPYRGGVWEEVILEAPGSVTLVCLSATVSNADQLAAWIARVRGSAGVVVETARAVELKDLFVVKEPSSGEIKILPTFVDGRANPQAARLDTKLAKARSSQGASHRHPHNGRSAHGSRSGSGSSRLRRFEVVERLSAGELLPAIYFVFSRAGCDDSVRQCMRHGVVLTTAKQRREIVSIVEPYVDALSDEDLAVLGYGDFLAGLQAGIAAHHAGMVPPFREAVEACFSEALVKVVFATETLALGINMPARSVVIEEVTKFGGSGHQELTPGEYTQLTGRAGRRGIDKIGYAGVICSPFHSFGDVARIAGSRPRALTSSFRPTYNLAVNLVRRHSRSKAYELVGSSFAQFLSEEDLTAQLDAVLDVLTQRGYVRAWTLSATGTCLASIYHEADLLVAEALEAGVFDGLDTASLAAVVSGLCYEARRGPEGELEVPNAVVGDRFLAMAELSEALQAEERGRGLPLSRGVDGGFASLVYDWARGRELGRVLRAHNSSKRRGPRSAQVMSGGDFVRNVKQVVDLLRQLAVVSDRAETANSARAAAERLGRGIVAASSVVTIPLEHGTIRASGQSAP